MTAVLMTDQVGEKIRPVPARSAPVVRPIRRAGQGRLRPPTRHRVAGVPHVVATPNCPPRHAPLPLAILIGLGALTAAVVFGLGALSGSGAGTVPDTTTVVRVAPGDSLSDLAARLAPGADPRAVIDRIRELNGLTGSDLRVGQPLQVPVSR